MEALVVVEQNEFEADTIKMYTINELQDILHIGRGNAYKIVKTKGFPTIQIGKKILIPKDELVKWIKDNMNTKINI